MNFCIFDVITYSAWASSPRQYVVVIWWIFVSLMWLHTAPIYEMVTTCCCDLMNFCIFDVITYSSIDSLIATPHVVIWWIFVSLMWLHTAHILCRHGAVRCDLMNFCIFDVITYSSYIKWVQRQTLWFDEFLYLWCDYIQLQVIFIGLLMVVIWWIFVSLMWLHTAAQISLWVVPPLWFDEFLYLWCDYIQQRRCGNIHTLCCDLMNFCIFDVITYSKYGIWK